MNRGRGDRQSKAAIEGRRETLAKMLKHGLSASDAQEALKASRSTIWRDLEKLRLSFSASAPAEFEEYRKAQLAVLERIEQAIIEGMIEPDVANAWRAVRADISKLLGLDAASKSVHVSVVDEGSSLFLRFKKAVAGLDEVQLEQELEHLASIPRAAKAPTIDANWFPKPERKKLNEGETHEPVEAEKASQAGPGTVPPSSADAGRKHGARAASNQDSERPQRTRSEGLDDGIPSVDCV